MRYVIILIKLLCMYVTIWRIGTCYNRGIRRYNVVILFFVKVWFRSAWHLYWQQRVHDQAFQ